MAQSRFIQSVLDAAREEEACRSIHCHLAISLHPAHSAKWQSDISGANCCDGHGCIGNLRHDGKEACPYVFHHGERTTGRDSYAA